MSQYSNEELSEALRAITSTLSKLQKVEPKLRVGTSQHTLVIRRMKALQISSDLILQALNEPQSPSI